MSERVRLGALARAGVRALSKYTGTLLAVFVAQGIVAAGCMVAIALILAQAFARLPIFDEAVDGDLVALLWSLRHGSASFVAIGGLVFGTLVLWQLVSWFVCGGLYGVFAQRPEGRAETARCFGANGAATYLAYARLAVCSLPAWLLVLFVFAIGVGATAPRIEYALTVPQLLGPLVLGALPALLLAHFFMTVTDYARVELALRHDSHAPGALVTYLRTLVFVAKRPLTLVHAGLGWVLFGLVTLAYAYLAYGHPMYGAEGAITLFFVRQGVALLRMAIDVAVLAGQVEVGRTRPLPPRRVEVTADAKS